MSTLILVFAALKILTFGTKAYNKAIALKTVLTNMENAGMKLNWLNTKRLILVKNIEKAQTLLQNKLLIKKNLLIHLENGLRAKGIILLKLQIFLMKVLAAVMSVNPFILAVVAIAGLVLAFGALTSVVEKNTEKYKENTKALQAANYESTRTVKSIQQITKQMEKFNNMSYLTPEQQEELETLNSQLSELYGEENQGSMAGRLIDGSINVELQIRLNQLAVEKEINAIHERRQELAESLLRTTNQQYMMAQEAEEFIVPL